MKTIGGGAILVLSSSWLALALGVGLGLGCGSSGTSSAAPATSGPDAGAEAAAPSAGDPPACVGPPGAGGGGPKARGDVGGALDPSGQKLVVFGGDTAVAACNDIPAHTHANDTWILDVGCGSWKQVTPPDGPGARARHAMVTDADRNRAIVFGGRTRSGTSGPYTALNDAWAFDFAAETWTKLQASGVAPQGRSNATAVVDPKGKQLVVFGGSTDTSGTAFTPTADTFVLDLEGGAWRAIAASPAPPARLFHAMAVDTDSRVAYVFSGGDENAFTGPFFKDVWALDLKGESWSKVATTGSAPAGRINASLVFDQSAKRLVVFGGHDDGAVGNQNEVYSLDVSATPAAWSRLGGGDKLNKPPSATCMFAPDFTTIDTAAPERRSAFALGARVDGRGFVVFGGKSDCGLLSDAWWWSGSTEAWTPMKMSPVGLSCLRTSTTCTGLCG